MTLLQFLLSSSSSSSTKPSTHPRRFSSSVCCLLLTLLLFWNNESRLYFVASFPINNNNYNNNFLLPLSTTTSFGRNYRQGLTVPTVPTTRTRTSTNNQGSERNENRNILIRLNLSTTVSATVSASATFTTSDTRNKIQESLLAMTGETTKKKPTQRKTRSTQDELVSSSSSSTTATSTTITTKKEKTTEEPKQTKNKRTKRTWEENLERLKEYKNQYGNCMVPYHYEHDKSLGLWVSTQRRYEKMGKLKQERKLQLDEIQFSWDANIHHWNDMLEELKKFHAEHGHCNVEQFNQYKGSSRKNALGTWVTKQRIAGALLTEDQRSKLNDLGFVWKDVVKARSDHHWEERFNLLQNYKRIHGHTEVPYKWSEDGVGLGNWVFTQRQNYRQGILRKEREDKLNEIGFVWKVRGNNPTNNERIDGIWMESFEKLKQFKTIHGHTNVPQKYEDDPALGWWVSNQRNSYRIGILKEHRQELLQDLGFEWKQKDKTFRKQWMDQYQDLLAFQKEYGHVEVPRKTHHDLYQWLARQRTFFANNRLESDRKELLNEIGVNLSVGPGSVKFQE